MIITLLLSGCVAKRGVRLTIEKNVVSSGKISEAEAVEIFKNIAAMYNTEVSQPVDIDDRLRLYTLSKDIKIEKYYIGMNLWFDNGEVRYECGSDGPEKAMAYVDQVANQISALLKGKGVPYKYWRGKSYIPP